MGSITSTCWVMWSKGKLGHVFFDYVRDFKETFSGLFCFHNFVVNFVELMCLFCAFEKFKDSYKERKSFEIQARWGF